MENENSSAPQQPLYPTPTTGFLAPNPVPEPSALQPVVARKEATNYKSIVILVLLLLTFFTPLGAVLFLPMVLVGLWIAFKKPHGTVAASTQPQSVGKSFLKDLASVAVAIAAVILVLIGGLFILVAVAASSGNFRMGS